MAWLQVLLLAPALAQTADEPWRTVRTEHFEVHYPLAAEAWTLDAVGRLEELNARVEAEVGFAPAPDRRIQIRVVDPYSTANGATFPFLHRPRIELWATPPEARSDIGHFRSWSELLLVHEDAHLVHLTRPSRNPALAILGDLTGLGPLVAQAPRWVMEGYATVVEGRLTGLGRPNGDARPTLLRGLALQGALPDYDEIDGNDRFGGGEDAYLVGSAYLEWLVARAGEDSLRALWRRMSARDARSFDEAFTGVFGEAPDVLYGRFVAEITAEAVELERADPAPAGTLFEPTELALDPPALSPDGRHLVVCGASEEDGWTLRVYGTATDAKAVDAARQRVDEELRKDPEDVAPVPPSHPPHEVEHELALRGVSVRDARWMPDGGSVLLTAGYPDAGGRLRWDLARWWPDSGRIRRITRHADVRAADPEPGGTTAVAVRQEWGRTRLVRVDLETGGWTAMPEGDGAVVDGPRVSPDGRRLAWLEAGDAGWSAVVEEVATGLRTTMAATHRAGSVVQLAWSRDGALYGVVGDEGALDAERLWSDGSPASERVASLPGGVLALEPGEGELWATTLTAHGEDLHRVPLADPLPTRAASPPPVGRPITSDAPGLPTPRPLDPRRYGLGPVEVQPLLAFGGTSAGRAGQVELAVRLGDPIGRDQVLLVGAVAAPGGGAGGGRASLTTSALPVALGADVWAGGDDRLGTWRAGAELSGARRVDGPGSALRVGAGALADRPLEETEDPSRELGFVDLAFSWIDRRSRAIGLALAGHGQAGALGGDGLLSADLGATLRLLRGGASTRVAYGRGWSTLSGLGGFVLGGVPDVVVPDAAEAFRVVDPAFAPGAWTGSEHERLAVAIGEPVSLLGVRHRFADGSALPGGGFTAVGIGVDRPVDAQPFLRLPSSRLGAGVACRLEGPGQGFDADPCAQLSDWAAWATITFRAEAE